MAYLVALFASATPRGAAYGFLTFIGASGPKNCTTGGKVFMSPNQRRKICVNLLKFR